MKSTFNKPLFIFDIDGTLTDENGKIPNQIIESIAHLWKIGFETTVITGRGYLRVLEVLGDQLHNIIGPETQLIGLEQGGRVCTSDGKKNIMYQSFSEGEIHAIINSISTPNIDFVGFFPEKINERSFIWTNDINKLGDLNRRFAHNANIVSSSVKELPTLLVNANPCMVTIKSFRSDYFKLMDKELNFYDGGKTINILPKNTDKSLALNHILTSKSPKHVGIAVDDMNDLPILNYPNLDLRIVVGNKISKNNIFYPKESVFLDSPLAMSNYLLSIDKIG